MHLRDFLRFIDSQKLFLPNESVLLAVSGGIDSAVMAALFHQAKFRFAIAHCNFGLRGKESDNDAVFVKKLASELNVPFFHEKFTTKDFAAKNNISVQMAARELRYMWFEKVRSENGFDWIATAHHLDDQVETFLINLIRGTGVSGLHGIPVKNGSVIRPLLFAYRKEIAKYTAENQILYREDHSNRETKYLRNKIRHELIPLLCNINPVFPEGLSASIHRIHEYEQLGEWALNEWKKRIIKKEGRDIVITIENLIKSAPLSIVPWELLSPYGFNETQVLDILSCLDKEGRKVFLSPTHRLIKDRKYLIISMITQIVHENSIKIGPFIRKKSVKSPVSLTLERITDPAKYEIPLTGKIASLDYDKLIFPLEIRKWRQGDAFVPFGMKKKKKLSDFFTDQKFSIKEKEQAWLICSGNDIVWIIGNRIDNRFRITASTREILKVMTNGIFL